MSVIECFLSHASHDADAGWIDPLGAEQRLRGIDVWRDQGKLQGGQANWIEIGKAISRCTLMAVFITPASIQRDALWNELRLADERWRLDPDFPIFPIRIGVSRVELDALCEKNGLHALSEHWDCELFLAPETPPLDPSWSADLARRIVDSAVETRVRSIGTRPLAIAIRTRAENGLQVPDLDIDWSSFFVVEPDASTWDRLLVALKDSTDAIKQRTRQPRIGVELISRLGVAFALGWAIPRTSPRQLDLLYPPPRNVWASDVLAADDGLTDFEESADGEGEPQLGALLVSISRDARDMYGRSPSLRRPGRILAVDRPDTPLAAESAAWAAERIGITVRDWCDKRGISEVHIFGAMPTGLAVFIGRQLNATADVKVFHDVNGVYREACRLTVGTKGAGAVPHAQEGPGE